MNFMKLKTMERKITNISFNDTLSSVARYSSVVRAFAHDAMGRRIDPSWTH